MTPSFLRKHHRNVIRKEEPNLYSIVTEPVFAIGQRAFLIRTPEGNLLWDSLALLDKDTKLKIESLGGVRAIAVSHPHFHTAMVDSSRAFGDARIHIHSLNKRWVMRRDANIRFWRGETLELFGGLRLVRTGGHFDGFQVAHVVLRGRESCWPEINRRCAVTDRG